MDKELKSAIIEQLVEYQAMAWEVHKRGPFKERPMDQIAIATMANTMVLMEESAALLAQLESLK